MTVLATMLAAAQRLLTYYNGDEKTAQNPGGLTGVGGMADNWDPCIQDIGTVANGVGKVAGSIAAAQSTIGMVWDAATAAADPGAGKLRATTATPAVGSYSLLVSATDSTGADIGAMLAELGAGSSAAKARARLVAVGDASRYLDLRVTAVSGAGAFRTVSVTCIGGPGGFAAGDAVALGWARTGDKGDTGAVGPAGGPVYYGAVTAGTANAQTLAGPLTSLSGNPSVEFVAGLSNGRVTRVNLQPFAGTLDAAAWSKGSVTVTADAAAWVDGRVVMDKVAEAAVSDFHAVQNVYLGGLSPTQLYTASIFLRAAERSKGRFVFYADNFIDGVVAAFDLSAGTAVASATGTAGGAVAAIDPLPGGVFAVSITGRLGGGHNTGGLYLGIRDASGADTYPGVAGAGLYAYGGQLEPGTARTPAIITGATGGSIGDGHATLAVGSTPARPLLDAQGRALTPGALVIGARYTATYDGTAWRLSGGAMTTAQAHALAASFL